MTRSLELRALSYAEKCQPRAAASFNKALQATPVDAGPVALARRSGVPELCRSAALTRLRLGLFLLS